MLKVEQATDPSEALRAMSYPAVLKWAGTDFGRLCAVADARGYYPSWIEHTLLDHGVTPTLEQSRVLARMFAAAGPHLSRRQRWIMRQLRERPIRPESELAELATSADQYAGYSKPERCIRHDLEKLSELGLVSVRGGLVEAVSRAPSTAAPSITLNEPLEHGRDDTMTDDEEAAYWAAMEEAEEERYWAAMEQQREEDKLLAAQEAAEQERREWKRYWDRRYAEHAERLARGE